MKRLPAPVLPEELLVGGVHGEVWVHAGDEDLTAQVRDGDPL